MNKDAHSIFEKYKNTSAKQQIVEEGMRDVLKSRNNQVITEVEAVKKTIKMSYGDFLAKYKKSIAKHTADFIDDDPENEDEAEQMAVDAVVDDLEHQGIHVELTNEGHDEKGMANKKEKYSQLSEMPFQMRKTKPLSLYCIPGDVPRLSHNTYHPGSEEIVPAGTPLSDWEKIKDTKNKTFFNKPNSPIKKKTETTHPYTEIDEKETMKEAAMINGKEVDRKSLEVDGVDANDYPDFSDAYVRSGSFKDGTKMSEDDLNEFNDTYSDVAQELALDRMTGMGDSYEGKHDETDMSNPEEKREVHIAKAILKATKDGNMKRVRSLAEKLLKMHGKK